MDAHDRGGGESDPDVGPTWLLKVALLFVLAVTVALGLGVGLGIIAV